MSMDEKGTVEATPEPKIKKIAGKEFDVSTPAGEAQYDTWVEAMATLVGRQSNEVGDLRKFKAEHAVTDNEVELLTKVAELREQGEHAEADKLLFGFTKETVAKSKRQLEAERANEKTWRAYFKERPELLEKFDEEVIRSVSETKVDLYKVEDPFAALDSFWKVTPKQAEKKAEKSEKPPVVPSGGARSLAPKTSEAVADQASVDDINSFLDGLGKSK